MAESVHTASQGGGEGTQCPAEPPSVQLPRELELLAEVIADLIAREYLKERGIISSEGNLP